MQETAQLRARVFDLEDQLKMEVEKRDVEIARLSQQLAQQDWT